MEGARGQDDRRLHVSTFLRQTKLIAALRRRPNPQPSPRRKLEGTCREYPQARRCSCSRSNDYKTRRLSASRQDSPRSGTTGVKFWFSYSSHLEMKVQAWTKQNPTKPTTMAAVQIAVIILFFPPRIFVHYPSDSQRHPWPQLSNRPLHAR